MPKLEAPSLLAILVGKPLLACLLLFAAIVVAVEIGRQFGQMREENTGTGAVNGAIFAILGLILAFSFSGAATRFDQRRDLIVQEANAIGTAYLRLDLLPPDAQPPLRAALKRYVDARIAAYADVGDEASFRARLRDADAISHQIWEGAVAAGRRPDAQPAVNIVVLPALNAMIDLAASRAFMTLMHPPIVIRYMLIALALVAALLAGIGFGPRRRLGRLHEMAFAVIVTMTIYITLDLEYPRAGLIRVDDFENAVVNFTRGK
jgi:hypothetical protein